MTWIARGSLFWKGTVTNVLKNEKLPVVGNRVSREHTCAVGTPRRAYPRVRAECSEEASTGLPVGCTRSYPGQELSKEPSEQRVTGRLT
jgi:hypothetical protein